MSLSGNLKTMDLAELLQWVTIGRKTGSLTFVQNKTKNHIYFKNGHIISSRSNEPTKQLGHFLLFQGKITELQLKRALEIQQQTRAVLGKILIQEGFITQEDVEKALKGRTEEVIYDLFLWEDGYFHFTSNGYNLAELIVINLDINAIIFEGVRRKDDWVRIRKAFPSNEVVLAVRSSEVDLKTLALTPLQKKLLFFATRGKTISEIILELHGSDFLVTYELLQLYENGVVEVAEIRATPPVRDDPAKLFNKGLELMQNARHAEAIAAFQEVLRLDPQNAWADEKIEEAEKAICSDLYRETVPSQKVPYFLVPEASLMRHALTHREGFVASRINGAWDVKSIVMLSPLREIEILQALDKLIKMGLVGLK
jgi:tetratricopeptide (TPR) repeat protein